jgi:hypothetical protein
MDVIWVWLHTARRLVAISLKVFATVLLTFMPAHHKVHNVSAIQRFPLAVKLVHSEPLERDEAEIRVGINA